jgi:hypothetical protein
MHFVLFKDFILIRPPTLLVVFAYLIDFALKFLDWDCELLAFDFGVNI